MKKEVLGPGDGDAMMLHWRRTLVPYLFIERTFYINKALMKMAMPYK